jgi:transposase-like protein
MSDRPLSPVEVGLVLGWYRGAGLTDIAAELGVSRQLLARLVRDLRQRGHDLAPRPPVERDGRTRTRRRG